MSSDYTIFTRSELLYKPGFLRKIYMKFSAHDPKYSEKIVYPEHLFTHTMCHLLGENLTETHDTESLTAEDPFGVKPCIVANNSYIARENIIKYFKLVTNINDWLTMPQIKTLDWLEDLVMQHLYPVTQMQLLDDRRPEVNSIFRYIHSPVRSFSKWIELKRYTDYSHKYMNLHGQMQYQDVAQHVYAKLSDKLGDKPTFFEYQEHELPDFTAISSLDIVVY